MLSYSSQENGLVLVERCSIPAIDIKGRGGEGRMIEVAGRMQYYLMVTVVGQDKSVKTFFQQLTLKIVDILYMTCRESTIACPKPQNIYL